MKTSNPHKIFSLFLLFIILSSCSEDEPIRTINRLEAKAGPDQVVVVNTLVTFDGTASKDGNNKPFQYEWKLKSRPAGSMAVLQEAGSATPNFMPDVAGLYKVELKIIQNDFFKTDEVILTAQDSPESQDPVLLVGTIAVARNLDDRFEDPAIADYVVAGDLIVGATLTVQPGVVIEFESDGSLQIFPEGSLVAKGTDTEKIVFTGKVREKGYWKGIAFFSNSPENELDNVTIAYAGGDPLPEMGNIRTNVALIGNFYSGAATQVSRSSFLESGGYGLYVKDRAHLNDFSENIFNNNTGSALFVPPSQLHLLDVGSHYSGNNGYDGVETGGPVDLDEEVSWPSFNDGSKYLVVQDMLIESGVKITEGATFEFATDKMVKVSGNGYLNAVGTDIKPVVFTARHPIQSHFWKGIVVTSTHDMNELRHAVVAYAGYSALPDLEVKANIAVAGTGKLSVIQSRIEHGLGWGIATAEGSQINQDFTTANTFNDFIAGNYKLPTAEPETTTIAGEWVDQWSFQNEHYVINENFFNQTTSAWFSGAADPWTMNPASGFGLKINEDGTYVWTIAEHSPMTGCTSYSAEYITGNVTVNNNQLSFDESYWRTKFYNSCAPDQNVDMNVEPGGMTLRFEINRMYNLFTGAALWELKIINPDGSSFSYYRL